MDNILSHFSIFEFLFQNNGRYLWVMVKSHLFSMINSFHTNVLKLINPKRSGLSMMNTLYRNMQFTIRRCYSTFTITHKTKLALNSWHWDK